MWAQQLIAPRQFAEVELPTPDTESLRQGELLVHVLAGGICGSDLPAFRGYRSTYVEDVGPSAARVPGFPLHEVVGEVLASHDPVHPVGARVVGWAHRFDALAEFCVVRGEDVAPFDSRLPPECAVMLQPLACVLYAVAQLGDIRGVRAAVLGQGPIGVLFSHVLKTSGAAEVIGVDPVGRVDVAATFLVDEPVQATSDRWALGLAEDDRPELVVEAIGHGVATLSDAVQATAPGGRIYYFGIADDPVYPFPMKEFLRRNLTLMAGVTRDRQHMLHQAQAYLNQHPGLAEAYVTDVVAARHAQRAFELAVSPAAEQLKVVLTYA